ncbi:MAG: HD domain-containing protein [Planctomycetaceae bacterium]|nr:HD domain-containing protein [Planctomycetaceae bacterium]
MNSDKVRRQITFEAARLMYTRQESEYYRAKMKAGRRICRGWVKPSLLPSNAEIRDEIQRFVSLYEGDRRFDNLRDMRLTAYRMMTLLRDFKPRLIGSTLTGHVRHGSDVDIHLFTSSIEAIAGTLDEQGLFFDIEQKQVRKHGEERVFTHIHVHEKFPVELTCYAADQAHYVFKSSITGKPIERANLMELESLLTQEYPDLDLIEVQTTMDHEIDRFELYRLLLIPLEQVGQSKRYHPEGDALYHSLQVFDLAYEAMPYDEEFLLAALLHDVGKAIDPLDHVATGVEALEGAISERTTWLIEHHMDTHKILDGTLGARAYRRLQEHPDFELLLLLGECDRGGRVPGADVPDLDEAIELIREVARTCQG